jgi:hypothetical protein
MSEGSRNRSFSQGRVEASQEDNKKRKRTGKGKKEEEVFGTSKKTARLPEVEKKSGREMEKILEKLEEVKKGNYIRNEGAEKRESRSQERNRTTKGRI